MTEIWHNYNKKLKSFCFDKVFKISLNSKFLSKYSTELVLDGIIDSHSKTGVYSRPLDRKYERILIKFFFVLLLAPNLH